jgi:hypothetical protein
MDQLIDLVKVLDLAELIDDRSSSFEIDRHHLAE